MSDTVKRAMDLVSNYQDPASKKMKGFDWRPLKDVQESLGGLPEIPSHVEKFGSFMDETARRAATKGLEPRDLLKAYLITRSSIQRRAQDVERIRASGLDLPKGMTGTIRPEGAMGEWLMSPMGQRYLNAAERGKVDEEAVAHAQQVMKPFGLSAESQALPWAAQNLPGRHKEVSELVGRALNGKSDPAEWRNFSKGLHGIGTAKAGFTASLLGRGDQPTLDARQVILQTGMPTSEAKKPMAKAGYEAVDRLAARQTALNPKMDSGLEPFRQHLTHHAIWDKAGNEETTHDDVVNALRNAKDGGRIEKSGGGTFGVGKFGDHVIDHAIRALGIPGHGLGDVHPDFIKALQQVSTPFSDDPEVVKRALAVAKGLIPSMQNKKASGGYYNVKQSTAPSGVKTTIGDIPGVKPLQQKQMSWEDFHKEAQGGTMINVGGDRSNLGRLTHINGKQLNWPVDLHAGPKYMLEPNPGAVWANSASHTTAFKKKIKEAAKRGPVYGVYSPMGPQSVDSSNNMFDALMAQINPSDIDKSHAKEFDDALRAGLHMEKKDRAKGVAAMGDWPGILNPKEAAEFASKLPGTHRSGIVKMMDKKGWVDRGFPEVGSTRVALTDPDVLNAPGNMLGHRVVRFDTDNMGPVDETAFKHSTYKEATPGSYVGDVPLVQRQYAMPDAMESLTAKPKWTAKNLIVHPYSDQATGRSTTRKMFEEQKQVQPINQRMLDSVMTGMERQKDYGFKAGGSAKKRKNIDRALSMTSMYTVPHDRDAG